MRPKRDSTAPGPAVVDDATRLDGRACAADLDARTAHRAAACTEAGVQPHLAVVIVGDDPASHVYVASKVRACERLGLRSTRIEHPANLDQSSLEAIVDDLNADSSVHGILVQSPLPSHLDEEAITDRILPSKDVDGFHPVNLGRLVQGRTDGLLPCTPSGVMELLRWGNVDLQGKRAVVLGRSRIVGMPMALLLAAKGADATVTVAHSRTEDLAKVCAEADVLVAAVGRPGMVQASWVKQGAVVVDVGINRVDDDTRERGWRLEGDVDEAVADVASKMTPVPGGVGPMTISMLMANTVRAAEACLTKQATH